MKTINVSQAEGPVLDWLVAKAKGHELMLFDTLWRDNAALKGYPVPDVERHLQWQPQKGRHVIVELRQLQLDQRNLKHLTPTRCAADIPDYATDWSQGGPIIEENGIGLLFDSGSACRKPSWFATPDDQSTTTSYEGEYFDPAFMVDEGCGTRGPTPLIAAMRCFCRSKLGDVVDIPEELCQQQKS